MVPERFCHCFSELIGVLSPTFKFELRAIAAIVRSVPEGAQAVCTVTVVIIDMLSPRVRSAWLCSAIGVRDVS